VFKLLLLCLSLHAYELGVNTHVDSTPDLARLKEIHATWIRCDFNWPGIEPQKDQWDFSIPDEIVKRAAYEHLHVYASFGSTPCWASQDGSETGVPNMVDWLHFIDVISRRYDLMVDAYGIWNEPNLEEFWTGSVQQYIDILQPAYHIIKTNSPKAIVAAPDTAHLYSARLGLGGFFAHLPTDSFDVLSTHIYGSKDFDSKLHGFKFMGITYKEGLLSMLKRFPGKDVWITEVGDNSTDEKVQRDIILKQLSALSAIPNVKKIFLFHFMDGDGADNTWGLLRKDGSPKLIWEALRHE